MAKLEVVLKLYVESHYKGYVRRRVPRGTLASNHGNQGSISYGVRPGIMFANIEGKLRSFGASCQPKELSWQMALSSPGGHCHT